MLVLHCSTIAAPQVGAPQRRGRQAIRDKGMPLMLTGQRSGIVPQTNGADALALKPPRTRKGNTPQKTSALTHCEMMVCNGQRSR